MGRKIGFPTANLSINDEHKLLPADGVYAVRVDVANNNNENNNCLQNGDNCQLPIANCPLLGMLNIGHRPTVNNGEERSIEVHILDFEDNIYGKPLKIEFLERLRTERHFDSIDELIAQLHTDRERVRNLQSRINEER